MSEGRYKVIDLETTVRNVGEVEQGGVFAASPFHPENQIVWAGWKNEGDSIVQIANKWNPPPLESDIKLVVGHNIAFDLEYLLMGAVYNRGLAQQYLYMVWYDWFHSGGIIWDTMLAEYILSGQDKKWPSLDYVSEKYGGTLKNDDIKEYWTAGIQTEDIPEKEICEYLVHDVENCELVFLEQMELAYQQGQLNLIMQMMEARMATISMEVNGTFFDKDAATKTMVEIEDEIKEMAGDLQLIVDTHLPLDVPLDVMSATQMSKFVFGGVHTYKVDEPIVDLDGNPVKYKTGKRAGQVKTRKTKKEVKLTPLMNPTQCDSVMGKNGVWKMDDDILKAAHKVAVSRTGVNPAVGGVISLLREIRKKQKDLTAFYKPYIGMVYYNGLLHPSYQHVSTDTGRLSCVKPNMQQASKKE